MFDLSQSGGPAEQRTFAPWEGLRVTAHLTGTLVAVEEPNLRVRLDGDLGEVLVDPALCSGLSKEEDSWAMPDPSVGRFGDSLHSPCACRVYCGDVPEDDPSQRYAVCKGLRRASEPPLVEFVVVHRDDLKREAS